MTKLLVLPHLLEQLTFEHQKALSRFIESPGNTGSNLEKLHTSLRTKVYSIRVNDVERLILTRSKGEWILCAVMSDHDYDKLLKNQNNWLDTQELIEFNDALAAKEELFTEQSTPIELQSAPDLQWHQSHFIVLDEEQKAAKKLDLPLIISGAPGSGKSCLALSIFLEHLKKVPVPEEQPQRLLYVAQSPILVAQMKREWDSIKMIEGVSTAHDVVFKTFQELHEAAAPGAEFVAKEHFEHWLKSSYKHNTDEILKNIIKTPEHVYLECRIASGYDSVKAYVKAGQRHSLFKEKQEQTIVWDIYQNYLKKLGNTIHPAFHSLEQAPGDYDLALVDETPDASRKEIRSLIELVKGKRNICFITGDHQRLTGDEPIISFLNSMFHPITPSHKQLNTSYRCPSKIIALANGALQFKYHVSGGLKQLDGHDLRYMESKNQENEGALYWLAKEEELKPLIEDKNNAHFAVVTSSEHKAEAIEKFGAVRVFTPEEIKGMEYHHVLIYRLLEQPDLQAASKLIEKGVVIGQPGNYCAQGATTQYNKTFNALFVALTRAQVSVSIYQPEKKEVNLTHLTHPLKHFIAASQIKEQPHVQHTPTHSSASEWEQKNTQLKALGLNKQAEAIDKQQTPVKQTIKHGSKHVNKMNSKPSPQKTNDSKPFYPSEHSIIKESTPSKSIQLTQQSMLDAKTVIRVDGGTLLHDAVENGHLDAVNALLRAKNVNVNLALIDGSTALHLAAEKDSRLKVVNALVKYNADVNKARMLDGATPLHIAADKDCPDVVTALLKHKEANVNTMRRDGATPLINASMKGHIKVVNVLLGANADVNQAMLTGITPLYAAAENNHIKVVTALLKKMADVNEARIIDGATPLHIAAMNGHINVVNALLSNGAEINKTTMVDGVTPLHLAAEKGYTDVLKVLLGKGANFRLKKHDGATPLHCAAQNGRVKTVKLLLNANDNVNQAMNNGAIPLHLAAQYGCIEVVYALLEKGADINQAALNGATPLLLAAQNGHTGVVNELLKKGAEINKAKDSGVTPLHHAAAFGHTDVVNTLLKNGAEINKAMGNGETALHLAAGNDRTEVVKELLNNGATLDLTICSDPNYRGIIMSELEKITTLNFAERTLLKYFSQEEQEKLLKIIDKQSAANKDVYKNLGFFSLITNSGDESLSGKSHLNARALY